MLVRFEICHCKRVLGLSMQLALGALVLVLVYVKREDISGHRNSTFVERASSVGFACLYWRLYAEGGIVLNMVS